MGSDSLGGGGGLPRLSRVITDNLAEGHGDCRWREKEKIQKSLRSRRESKQIHLELEQDEGVGPEAGSSCKRYWRRQVGWFSQDSKTAFRAFIQ